MRIHRNCSTRRNASQWKNGANRIQIGVDFLGEDFARRLVLRHEGRDKVVLYQRHPAIVGFCRMFILAVCDLGEIQLLEFFRIGIYRRACESTIKLGLSSWFVAIAHQLQVQRRRNRRTGCVGDIVPDINIVITPFKGEGFDQFDAAGLRLQYQLHFVAGTQFARARLNHKSRFVIGECASDQTGLRQIRVPGSGIEQHQIFGRINRIFMFQEFEILQLAACGIYLCFNYVGGDRYDFALERCGTGHRCGDFCRRLRISRERGGLRHRGGGRSGSNRFVLLCHGGRKHRRFSVMAHPVVPKDQQRHRKHDPKDGTFDIHKCIYQEKSEIREWLQSLATAEVGSEFFSGTGSNPPGCHGWHLHRRLVAKTLPFNAPCWRTA